MSNAIMTTTNKNRKNKKNKKIQFQIKDGKNRKNQAKNKSTVQNPNQNSNPKKKSAIGKWNSDLGTGNIVNVIAAPKGRKNQTILPEFIDICKMGQVELSNHVTLRLKERYKEVFQDDGFVYARGNAPILLTAHMDTVHKSPIINYYEDKQMSIINEFKAPGSKSKFQITSEKHVLTSPQGIGGDDRCGVYLIMKLVEELPEDLLPSILFCEDEEIGGVGSEKFVKTEFINELRDLKFLVELDRQDNNDAVFYDCGNEEFIAWIEEVTGYKEAWGSFSDISHLSPACDVASVNLSVGYLHQHTLNEIVVIEDMLHSKTVVENLIRESVREEVKQFKYEEKVFGGFGGRYGKYAWDLEGWDDYYDYNHLTSSYQPKIKKSKSKAEFEIENELLTGEFYYYDRMNERREEQVAYVEGWGESDCIARFLTEHPTVCWADVFDHYFM